MYEPMQQCSCGSILYPQVPSTDVGDGGWPVDQVPSTHPAVYAGARVWPPEQHLRYWLHCFAWADLHLLMFDYFGWYFGYS